MPSGSSSAGARTSRRPGSGAKTPPAAPSSAPRVLLVEDDRDNREMYRQYLEWEGFRVIEARDGLQAVARAAAFKPTVIVTDLALPRLSGWEAVRRLKAKSATMHIPVLALSAHAFVDDAARARAAGCDSYLSKPCLPEELVRAIRVLLRQATAEGPSRSARPARRRADGRVAS